MDGMEITQFTYFQQVDLTKEYALLYYFCSNHTRTTQLFDVHILDVAKNANYINIQSLVKKKTRPSRWN